MKGEVKRVQRTLSSNGKENGEAKRVKNMC